jgi:cell division protein FtsW
MKPIRRAANRVRSESIAIRKHRPDVQIMLYMSLLMLLGLVVMFAIGSQRANVLNAAFGTDYSSTYFFGKQFVSIVVAVVAFCFMALVPYEYILKHQRLMLFVGIGACVLLAFASMIGWGIAQHSYGATRWFNLGPLGGLQPSEILKFGVLIYSAIFLGSKMRDGTVNDWRETLVPLGIVMAVSQFLIIVVQRDLGTGISLLSIVLAMLFVAGLSRRLLAIVVGCLVLVGTFLVISAPHRLDRVATFLRGDTTSTSDASSYHIEHAKIAIGTGGLLGVGIGNSVQATGYLPEAINDSVFAIMGETFGFLGLVATIALFVALLMRLLKVMDHLVDYRLKLITAGVFGWFGVHVVLNIGAMIGLIPLTGITLPLLSFGGTSMLFIAAALGLVFQLSRYTVHGSNLKEVNYENSRSGRGLGRPRHTSRRSA